MGIMQLNIKDNIKRLKTNKFENRQKCFKCLQLNIKLWCFWWARHKLSALPKRKIRNRCLLTGRGKAINQSFKLSRLEFSRWAKSKILCGVTKSSW